MLEEVTSTAETLICSSKDVRSELTRPIGGKGVDSMSRTRCCFGLGRRRWSISRDSISGEMMEWYSFAEMGWKGEEMEGKGMSDGTILRGFGSPEKPIRWKLDPISRTMVGWLDLLLLITKSAHS